MEEKASRKEQFLGLLASKLEGPNLAEAGDVFRRMVDAGLSEGGALNDIFDAVAKTMEERDLPEALRFAEFIRDRRLGHLGLLSRARKKAEELQFKMSAPMSSEAFLKKFNPQ